MILQNCNVIKVDSSGATTLSWGGNSVTVNLEWVDRNSAASLAGATGQYGQFVYDRKKILVPIESFYRYAQKPGLRFVPLPVLLNCPGRKHYGHALTIDFALADVEPLVKQYPRRTWLVATEKLEMEDKTLAHLIGYLGQ